MRRLAEILIRQYRLNKHLHLRQLKILLAVEDMGGTGEGGPIGKMQRAHQTLESVQADAGEDSPADAPGHHLQTAADVVNPEIDMAAETSPFLPPPLNLVKEILVCVPANVGQLV